MTKTLSVNAIQNGTVIDHVTSGQAMRIVHLLGLEQNAHPVTLGLHLASKRLGKKDLIKIEDRFLTDDEANEVMVFAPNATINIVRDFKVANKIKPHFPPIIKSVFICPNTRCITQVESIPSFFHLVQQGKQINLSCHYCDKQFDRDQVKVVI